MQTLNWIKQIAGLFAISPLNTQIGILAYDVAVQSTPVLLSYSTSYDDLAARIDAMANLTSTVAQWDILGAVNYLRDNYEVAGLGWRNQLTLVLFIGASA